MRWPLAITVGVALAASILPVQSARAQAMRGKYGELLKRLPETANTMMLVDVDGMLDSPIGRRERWREEIARRPTGVLGVPGDASKLVVAASIDLRTHQERWKLGMMQARVAAPRLSVLAAREGGYLEQLGGLDVAWTPRNMYLFSFPEKVVGFVVPADRQALKGWIGAHLATPRTFPPGWADRAVFRADAGSQVVLAVDLSGCIGPKGAELWLRTIQDADVQRDKINFELLAKSLATAKSALLEIDTGATIEGTIQVDFESPVERLRSIAKPIVLEALSEFGASIEDLNRWSYEVKGPAILMRGPLSEGSLRRILGVVSAPTLTPSGDPGREALLLGVGTPKEDAPAGDPSSYALSASRRYFRSVVDVVQGMKTDRPESQRGMRLWYDRSAKQIEDLPLLYVDNDLLSWGSGVARSLREIASGMNYAAKDVDYRIAGTANNNYGGHGDNYGGYGVTGGGGRLVDTNVIKKQSNAKLSVEIDGRRQALETSIADIRRQMVARYKLEF